MQIHICPGNGVPVYLQIARQVKHRMATGCLAPDAELPPVWFLAERLLVNPQVVARAYRELELAGLFPGRPLPDSFAIRTERPPNRWPCDCTLPSRLQRNELAWRLRSGVVAALELFWNEFWYWTIDTDD